MRDDENGEEVRNQICFGIRTTEIDVVLRSYKLFLLKSDGNGKVQKLNFETHFKYSPDMWQTDPFTPIQTDFAAEGLLLEGGVMKMRLEVDVEVPDELLSKMGLGHLKIPREDQILSEAFQVTEEESNREIASLLIRSSDGKEFYAGRELFIHGNEKEYFKVFRIN